MLARVIGAIERYRMFAPGARLGVAVSGGADSVCLLHLLLELAARWDLRLTVLHLDHMLRGSESDADADFVRDLAARYGLPFLLRRAAVADEPDNLEQAARRARLDFFSAMVREGAVERVAVGHTRSDQAETVLFRLLRGAGGSGLSGIRPVTGEGVVRPLLDVDRAEVEMYLGERGLAWREDSSNRSPEFARNRIRHQLLPELAAEWNPRIVEILAQTADWAQQEEEYWNCEIDRLAEAMLAFERGALLVDAGRLADLPRAAARRLVRRALHRVRGDLRGVEFSHVESILSLAGEQEGHGRLQAPGADVMRSFAWLRFAAPGNYPGVDAAYEIALTAPGISEIPGADFRICTELVENLETIGLQDCVYNEGAGWVDWASVSGPLILRNWRPGDQYQPAGHSGGQKIKDLFQQARIPLWERRQWPVVAAKQGIVWTRRFGPAARHVVCASSRVVLKIREERISKESGRS
jgi:tRNA(Ile)-lysidine synthase